MALEQKLYFTNNVYDAFSICCDILKQYNIFWSHLNYPYYPILGTDTDADIECLTRVADMYYDEYITFSPEERYTIKTIKLIYWDLIEMIRSQYNTRRVFEH